MCVYIYIFIHVYAAFLPRCLHLRCCPPWSGPVAGSFATRFGTHLGHWAVWRMWSMGKPDGKRFMGVLSEEKGWYLVQLPAIDI